MEDWPTPKKRALHSSSRNVITKSQLSLWDIPGLFPDMPINSRSFPSLSVHSQGTFSPLSKFKNFDQSTFARRFPLSPAPRRRQSVQQMRPHKHPDVETASKRGEAIKDRLAGGGEKLLMKSILRLSATFCPSECHR